MRSHVASLTLIITLTVATPLSAQVALEPLTPSGPWAIDFGERGCELKRDFGTGEQLLIVTFSRALAPLETGINIRGAGIGVVNDADRISIAAPAGDATETSIAFGALRSPRPEDPPLAGRFRSLANLAEVTDASVLTFERGRRSLGSLRLSQFSAALAALSTCQDDLYRSSGIDPAAMRRIAVDAEPDNNEATWATSADLPAQFRRMAQPLLVTMRLDVGVNGRVTNCVITSSSGEALLDLQSCRVMSARARYRPARDAEGNAVPTV